MSQKVGERPLMFVANSAWNLANFRGPLIEDFIAKGHDVVTAACPDGHEGRLVEMGARFLPIPFRAARLSPLHDVRTMLALLRAFGMERPRLIFSFTVKPNIYSALAARMVDTPIVPTISGLGSSFLAGGMLSRAVEAMYGIAFRKARAVFFQNATDRELFVRRKLVEEESTRLVAGSGVDLAHFQPAQAKEVGSLTFLYVGRMLRDKGLVELADAIRMVRSEGIDAKFMLLGDSGSDNPSAVDHDLIERWVEDGLVVYHEPVRDVRPFIASADCMILPSYREGLPRSLLEGAAMAKPLLASNVPGCRDVVVDGENGILFEARSAEFIAQAIRTFAGLDPNTRSAMGSAARRKVEKEFSVDRVIHAYARELA